MKSGCKIKVDMGWHGMYSEWEVFEVEEFRYCLGIFKSEEHREAGVFTPLSELYLDGPESEEKYISNFGTYRTDQVPAWIDCAGQHITKGEGYENYS